MKPKTLDALLKFSEAVATAIVRHECAKDVDFRGVEAAQVELAKAISEEQEEPNKPDSATKERSD